MRIMLNFRKINATAESIFESIPKNFAIVTVLSTILYTTILGVSSVARYTYMNIPTSMIEFNLATSVNAIMKSIDIVILVSLLTLLQMLFHEYYNEVEDAHGKMIRFITNQWVKNITTGLFISFPIFIYYFPDFSVFNKSINTTLFIIYYVIGIYFIYKLINKRGNILVNSLIIMASLIMITVTYTNSIAYDVATELTTRKQYGITVSVDENKKIDKVVYGTYKNTYITFDYYFSEDGRLVIDTSNYQLVNFTDVVVTPYYGPVSIILAHPYAVEMEK